MSDVSADVPDGNEFEDFAGGEAKESLGKCPFEIGVDPVPVRGIGVLVRVDLREEMDETTQIIPVLGAQIASKFLRSGKSCGLSLIRISFRLM